MSGANKSISLRPSSSSCIFEMETLCERSQHLHLHLVRLVWCNWFHLSSFLISSLFSHHDFQIQLQCQGEGDDTFEDAYAKKRVEHPTGQARFVSSNKLKSFASLVLLLTLLNLFQTFSQIILHHLSGCNNSANGERSGTGDLINFIKSLARTNKEWVYIYIYYMYSLFPSHVVYIHVYIYISKHLP